MVVYGTAVKNRQYSKLLKRPKFYVLMKTRVMPFNFNFSYCRPHSIPVQLQLPSRSRGRGLSGASAPTAEPSFGSDLVDPTPPAEQTVGRGRGRGRDRGRVRDRGIAPATAFQEADPTPPTEPNPPADPTPPTEPNPPTRSNPPAHPNNVGRGHGRGRGRDQPTIPAQPTVGRGRGRGRSRGRVKEAAPLAQLIPPGEPTIDRSRVHVRVDPTPPAGPSFGRVSSERIVPHPSGSGQPRLRGGTHESLDQLNKITKRIRLDLELPSILCCSGNSSSTFPVAYKTISPVSVIDGPTVINIVITPVETDVTESVTPA
ncbi:hypothetical protein DAPPUDRAFT_108636 [Daphnia pulex]|uniref:Uncharacterized protein n=1 Tax=Daphnia pulex TaxID=6669 RepID=E9H0Q8_DAPPU|nr:hypothetical protein DAPPUDRAFT_108636 [Daphnia pulex]|eukprot:EFX74706.1 hypothetical protein DAPPUDRAFT_108636 [Daphnia pulex]